MKYAYFICFYLLLLTRFSLLNATPCLISTGVTLRSIETLVDTFPIEKLRIESDRIAEELKREKIKVARLRAKIRDYEERYEDAPVSPGAKHPRSPSPEPKIIPDPKGIAISELDNLNIALSNAEGRASDLEYRNRKLRDDLVDLRDENRRLKNKNSQLKADKRRLENEIDQLESKIDSLEIIIRNQRDEIRALNNTIQAQLTKIGELKAYIKLLEEDYSFMINQFNQNNTQLYAIYDFPRTKKGEDNYVLLKNLPNTPEMKMKKMKEFYIEIQLFIPENAPEYQIDLYITDKKTGSLIIEQIDLILASVTRPSQKGYNLFIGQKRFDQGLRDPTTLGNFFKKKQGFFKKNKAYSYEIKLDLGGSGLLFPKGAFRLD